METRDLKRLRRSQLLELMLEQQEVIEQQEKTIETLRQELADRQLHIRKAGSLAEASLAVTKIFEEAQKAADLYLENIKAQAETKE